MSEQDHNSSLDSIEQNDESQQHDVDYSDPAVSTL